MFILMNEEKHMKGYMEYLERLINIAKNITEEKTRDELMEIETRLETVKNEIETQMRIGGIPLYEYKMLKYITFELDENLRHTRRLQTLRREFGYAGINNLIAELLGES